LIRVENLSISTKKKHRLDHLINNINFEILDKSVTILAGDSGSGKTILAKTISGLLNNNFIIKGNFYLKNKKIEYNNLKKLRGKTVFYLPQNPKAALNPVYTIKNQFKELENDKIDLINKIENILKNLNFNNPKRILNSYPFELSEGECQRIIFAMGYILNPKLFILDEPFKSLDYKTSESIIKNILTMNIEYKNSILLITHKIKSINKLLTQNKYTLINFLKFESLKNR
jgi:ABC-type dipeptide/oligopeptide/nickel transport system ATPase component